MIIQGTAGTDLVTIRFTAGRPPVVDPPIFSPILYAAAHSGERGYAYAEGPLIEPSVRDADGLIVAAKQCLLNVQVINY